LVAGPTGKGVVKPYPLTDDLVRPVLQADRFAPEIHS